MGSKGGGLSCPPPSVFRAIQGSWDGTGRSPKGTDWSAKLTGSPKRWAQPNGGIPPKLGLPSFPRWPRFSCPCLGELPQVGRLSSKVARLRREEEGPFSFISGDRRERRGKGTGGMAGWRAGGEEPRGVWEELLNQRGVPDLSF